MRKILGFALVALSLPLAASAQEATGKIKTVDRAESAFVLEDGTRLWIDEGRLSGLREGEKVQASYTTTDGKKVVTELHVRTVVDGIESTNLGSTTPLFDHTSVQASE